MKFKHNIKNLYLFWKDIWSREISASLAFYFFIGFTPALCVLLFFIGNKFSLETVKNLGETIAFSKIYEQIVINAKSATEGANVFFLLTSIYSTINLLYRFRRCGEVLYNYEAKQKTLYKKLISLALIALVTIALSFVVTLFFIIEMFAKGIVLKVLTGVFVTLISGGLAILMNIIICPYKLSVKDVVLGSILTLILWIFITIGYTIYLNYFSRYDKLYGVLGDAFALILYVYFIMQAFTFGIAYNIMNLGKVKNKKKS